MIKQTTFLAHRDYSIPPAAIIICGQCEMPIWRMTTFLHNLYQYAGYCGIPREFITMLDGSPPAPPRAIAQGEPCWECPKCGKYIIKDKGVIFEMHPNFDTWLENFDASIEHKLRFFVAYESVR